VLRDSLGRLYIRGDDFPPGAKPYTLCRLPVSKKIPGSTDPYSAGSVQFPDTGEVVLMTNGSRLTVDSIYYDATTNAMVAAITAAE
jgi:hypothetical protein